MGAHTTQWEETTTRCPECLEYNHLYVNKDTALLSYPQRYTVKCFECAHQDYVLAENVELVEDVKLKEQTRNFMIISILMLIIMMPVALWAWVQFVKFVNWLIECGW